MKYNGKEYEVCTEHGGSCSNCDFDGDADGCGKVECPEEIGGWREVKTPHTTQHETVCATLRQVGDVAISQGGLTKREWFAGMALKGMLGFMSVMPDGETDYDYIASHSYDIADAMIKAGKETE